MNATWKCQFKTQCFDSFDQCLSFVHQEWSYTVTTSVHLCLNEEQENRCCTIFRLFNRAQRFSAAFYKTAIFLELHWKMEELHLKVKIAKTALNIPKIHVFPMKWCTITYFSIRVKRLVKSMMVFLPLNNSVTLNMQHS